MSKKCKRCGQLKDLTEFSKASNNKDGYNNTCKACVVARNRDYWRTPEGRLSQIYAHQQVISRERGHPPPQYTRDELYAWAFQNQYEQLYLQWKSANYPKNLTPSIDRLNDLLGYSLQNIQLITWNENNQKMYDHRKSCKRITRQNRKVEQLSLDGDHVSFFDSISHAARSTGITRTNINGMCKNKPNVKSVGGFIWRYAD